MQRLILLAAVPALLVGAMIMRQHGIGTAQWGLNLGVGAIALLASAFVRGRASRRDDAGSRRPLIFTLIAMALLGLSFIDAGVDGVHRWVPFGPLTLYAGAIALPLVISASGELLRQSSARSTLGMLLAVATAFLLMLQPDAAQATGLAAAVVALALQHRGPQRPLHIISVVAVVALAAWSWFRPDPLPPVPHVEGMLRLAQESGGLWLAAAIVSLAMLPLPFLTGRSHPGAATSRAMGAYIVACVLVPLVRNYPFPLLGFGVSPIIGYAIALSAVPPRN